MWDHTVLSATQQRWLSRLPFPPSATLPDQFTWLSVIWNIPDILPDITWPFAHSSTFSHFPEFPDKPITINQKLTMGHSTKRYIPFQIGQSTRECSPPEDLDQDHPRISCDKLRWRLASVPALGRLPCSAACVLAQKGPANICHQTWTYHKLCECSLENLHVFVRKLKQGV